MKKIIATLVMGLLLAFSVIGVSAQSMRQTRHHRMKRHHMMMKHHHKMMKRHNRMKHHHKR